jgi:hypothetical protein
MKGPDTAAAIKAAIIFFLDKGVELTTIRMDNQSSPEVRQVAQDLHLEWDLVNPYQKEPNRAERAIRTGKNHMIATRSGFHKDCPHTFIDRQYLPIMSCSKRDSISQDIRLLPSVRRFLHGIAPTLEVAGLTMVSAEYT